MADVFTKGDARAALAGRRLLFMGDSILRNLYQDLVHLLEAGTLTPNSLLKKKGVQVEAGELPGDRLVPGTGHILPGRDYQEVNTSLQATHPPGPRVPEHRQGGHQGHLQLPLPLLRPRSEAPGEQGRGGQVPRQVPPSDCLV